MHAGWVDGGATERKVEEEVLAVLGGGVEWARMWKGKADSRR